MKGRIVAVVLLLCGVLLVVMIARNTYFDDVEVPTRLKGEAARNPFYTAIRFSEVLGVEAAWERVFATPRSDAVIMLSAWNWNLSRTRRERIEHWVEGGGRLILDNSLIGEAEEFERWSGIGELEREKKNEDDADEESVEEEFEPEVKQAPADDSFLGQFLLEDCTALAEDGSERSIQVCGVNDSRSLTSTRKALWALRDGDKIHALRTAVGRGSVTVINAAPFRYRQFLAGDHPVLFATMAQLHHDDFVLFLTEEDRSSIIGLMWRFGAPAVLLILACVTLLVWRSMPRFGPAVAGTLTARRSLAEQIRGTGLFALRFGSGKALHAAAARALRDAAIRKFPQYDRLSSEERVALLARACGLSTDDLGPAMNHIGVRSSHELRQAIAVLESARRSILKKTKHGN